MTPPARPAVSLLALLLAGTAAGCTSTSAGVPGSAGSVSATDETEVTSTAPKRPRELTLDGVDPCALLPRDQYPRYHLDTPGVPRKDDQGADSCLWSGEIGYLGVTLVTYEGVEAQEGRYGQRKPAASISGFPAYTIRLPDDDRACFISVDVADGQYLDVQVGLDSFPADVPSVCEYSHQFASALMTTLEKS